MRRVSAVPEDWIEEYLSFIGPRRPILPQYIAAPEIDASVADWTDHLARVKQWPTKYMHADAMIQSAETGLALARYCANPTPTTLHAAKTALSMPVVTRL